ncbi:hypothetical protein VTN77DRAFT_1121 [Rasamsonia byssochlamydoides]|uniref:uncharacterized protein n=1 Tax=Rasamsonia byssochlamydoides TaxID=89139 RepID=UPI003743138A
MVSSVSVPITPPQSSQHGETLRNRIEIVAEDLPELERFYNIKTSPERAARLRAYYDKQLTDLATHVAFNALDQQGKVDYLLLKNHLERLRRQLELEVARDRKTEPLLQPFASTITALCENRQKARPLDAKKAAQDVHDVQKAIQALKAQVQDAQITLDRTSAFRAAITVDELRAHLAEWYGFYQGYDPLFTWWVSKPYAATDQQLGEYAALIREKLVGIKPGEQDDAIVGQPIGRDGLLVELEAEKINYTPEELLWIGEQEYAGCETEMKKISRAMGFGDDWRRALAVVREDYVEPGQQTRLVRDLAAEAIEYVQKHDLVTVPPLAAETWRMFMMASERQKVNPFFLGGESIIVSYPPDTMYHEAKLMSMRGNNIHYSRATVFHELIPGHHLQLFINTRYRPYRRLFGTPFSIEGWALYWEIILWDDERFPKTAYKQGWDALLAHAPVHAHYLLHQVPPRLDEPARVHRPTGRQGRARACHGRGRSASLAQRRLLSPLSGWLHARRSTAVFSPPGVGHQWPDGREGVPRPDPAQQPDAHRVCAGPADRPASEP